MATKRKRSTVDDAGVKRERLRRLDELVAENGNDESLMGGFVDVVAGGVAHRVNPLLLAQSEVFRAMLTSGLREAAQRRIELPDTTPESQPARP